MNCQRRNQSVLYWTVESPDSARNKRKC